VRKTPWAVWTYRSVLIIILPALIYAGLNPSFAGWQVVPHGFLYRHGVPYAAVLWFEVHFGEIFHSLAAFVLTLMLPAARILGPIPMRLQRVFWCIALGLAAPAVECFQWYTGRGFDYSDLLYHYLGMGIAIGCWSFVGIRNDAANFT